MRHEETSLSYIGVLILILLIGIFVDRRDRC